MNFGAPKGSTCDHVAVFPTVEPGPPSATSDTVPSTLLASACLGTPIPPKHHSALS